jgi:hypothetical protein
MATATTTKTKKRGQASRRSWRGWMTLTDLIAATCAAWAAVGGWQDTHSVGECALRFAIVYGAVHAFAPMVRGGSR